MARKNMTIFTLIHSHYIAPVIVTLAAGVVTTFFIPGFYAFSRPLPFSLPADPNGTIHLKGFELADQFRDDARAATSMFLSRRVELNATVLRADLDKEAPNLVVLSGGTRSPVTEIQCKFALGQIMSHHHANPGDKVWLNGTFTQFKAATSTEPAIIFLDDCEPYLGW